MNRTEPRFFANLTSELVRSLIYITISNTKIWVVAVNPLLAFHIDVVVVLFQLVLGKGLMLPPWGPPLPP